MTLQDSVCSVPLSLADYYSGLPRAPRPLILLYNYDNNVYIQVGKLIKIYDMFNVYDGVATRMCHRPLNLCFYGQNCSLGRHDPSELATFSHL